MATVLSALVVSECSQTLFVTERCCAAHLVQSCGCLTCREALQALTRKKFDFLVLDFDLAAAQDILATEPKDFDGRETSIIGLSPDPLKASEVHRKRVSTWVRKPFNNEAIGVALRGTYKAILKARRTSFRHAVNINAVAAYELQGIRRSLGQAIVVDISHTGMCLSTGVEIPKGTKTLIDFRIPGGDETVEITADVIWSAQNRTGLEFCQVQPHHRQILGAWLDAKCPWQPELVEKPPAYRMFLR